jgi:hypothetical protein
VGFLTFRASRLLSISFGGGVDDYNSSSNGSSNVGSENENSGNRCSRLTEHVNAQLRSDESTCGQSSWISNFLTVTGGSLPGPNTSTADNDERLGNNECRSILPQSYSLYKVADMRLDYFGNPPEGGDEFYGRVFGGRAGLTPVLTVL